jgi:hypothetical protein
VRRSSPDPGGLGSRTVRVICPTPLREADPAPAAMSDESEG